MTQQFIFNWVQEVYTIQNDSFDMLGERPGSTLYQGGIYNTTDLIALGYKKSTGATKFLESSYLTNKKISKFPDIFTFFVFFTYNKGNFCLIIESEI